MKTETISGREMRFLDNNNILNYPNIIILNTEETFKFRAWHDGMINMKSSGAEDIITEEN